MRTKITGSLFIAMLLMILLGSCRFFEKQKLVSNDVDTLLNSKLEGYITEEKHQEEISRIRSEVNLKLDSISALLNDDVTLTSNKFHIITGSFTVPENAQSYSKTMKDNGFDGKIIPGFGRFNLVTAKSYNNLRVAINDLEAVRNNTNTQAWIYISR